MQSKGVWTVSIIAVAALAAASAPGLALPPTATTHVNIQNFAFAPQHIQVAAGDTVTWHNLDGFDHTATGLAGLFNTGTIAEGASGSATFANPGLYPYQCTLHPTMLGTVLVLP